MWQLSATLTVQGQQLILTHTGQGFIGRMCAQAKSDHHKL